MSLYPTLTVERYHNSAWEDITAYVVGKIRIDIGFMTDSYTDRLAKPGKIDFTLNNASSHFDISADFKKNAMFRITQTWNGASKIYVCYMDYIDPPKFAIGDESVFIRVHTTDWLGVAYRHLLKSIVVQSDKRIDEAVTTLLTDTPINPTSTDFETGTQTFPIVFDAIRMGKSSLYSELNHLAMSELACVYLANNDTLVIENYDTRNQFMQLTEETFSVAIDDGSALLKEDGGYLLKEDGGKILLNKAQSYTYDGTLTHFQDADIVHGKNIINDVTFSVHPRTIGTALQHLGSFNLYTYVDSPPIMIADGETVTLKGKYFYQTSTLKTSVSAAMDVADMLPQGSPGTDYSEFRFNPTGTTGMTLTFTGGADAWRWVIENNSGVDKALEYYFIWGRPIYSDESIEYLKEDEASQTEHGKNSITIDQPYQQALTIAAAESALILENETEPRTQVKSVSMVANASVNELSAYMLTDIGDLRRVVIPNPGINNLYFVHGIKADIDPGGVTEYTLKLKEYTSYDPIALNFSGVIGSKNRVNFGTHSQTANLAQKTISAWVYLNSLAGSAPLITRYGGIGAEGWHVFLNSTGKISTRHIFTGASATWETTNDVLTALIGGWHHIAVTYNNSSTTNDPIIYIDGVSVAVTETTPPSGTIKDDSAKELIIGNTNYSGAVYVYNLDGLVKDLRIYNTVKSPTDIATLAAGENDYLNITTGLVFHAGFAKGTKFSTYTGHPISATMPVYDRINGTQGVAGYDTGVTSGELKGADPSETSYS